MKRTIGLMVIIGFSLSVAICSAQSEVAPPRELAILRLQHEQELKAAAKPILERHERALQRLENDLISRRRIEDALVVKNERMRVRERLQNPTTLKIDVRVMNYQDVPRTDKTPAMDIQVTSE